MQVRDFHGVADISENAALLERLRTVRLGRYGAFVLSHKGRRPELYLLFNGRMAYLHYFPYRDYLTHAGFRPTGMAPPRYRNRKEIQFRQLDESDMIDVPASSIISVEAAESAASEFLEAPKRPASISWEML
jgi:hypothetical protein